MQDAGTSGELHAVAWRGAGWRAAGRGLRCDGCAVSRHADPEVLHRSRVLRDMRANAQ